MDLRSFGQAIRELAEEKGVATERVIETIELAIAAAYKKDYGKKGQIIRAKFNPETGGLSFSQIKIVVDESMLKPEDEEEDGATEAKEHSGPPGRRGRHDELEDDGPGEDGEMKKVRFNPERHILIEDAAKTKADAAPGEELEFPLDTKQDFGRIASQTAKQVIIQRIREAEREATYGEYKTKEGEIVSGIVQRVEGRNVFIDLGRGTALLPPEEQIPRERYGIGERLKGLLLLVERDARGPGIIISRSHRRFLEKLFELEVPEIASSTVVIKGISREPGSRSKIAVASTDPAVDPVGSMVGQRGVRVSTVIHEIGGEKIDIIEWAEDPARFIANALSPAKVLDVTLDEANRVAIVIAPEDQLSLAIGRGGQNVRLAAKLTGWRIDVRSAVAPESTQIPSTEENASESPAEKGADTGGSNKPEPADAPATDGEIAAAEDKNTKETA